MYQFNTTIKINDHLVEEITRFITQVHFVEIKESGLADSVCLYTIEELEEDGKTYSLQYKFSTEGTFNQFYSLFDVKLKRHLASKYGMEAVFFSTLLKKDTNFEY